MQDRESFLDLLSQIYSRLLTIEPLEAGILLKVALLQYCFHLEVSKHASDATCRITTVTENKEASEKSLSR